ncbi:divalent metal cation transporter [Verrucomicrobia bacterium]|nr:divalent metal cation transporter [Verrucomicrobiota bacterium]MDA7533076.1 divalent metal cation transporter [Verrucomicrobiota bacterium]
MSEHQDRFEMEKALIDSVEGKGAVDKAKVFVRLSGPGWLQSAITLGGGSLASGLFLGVIGGYQMLWVQWLAMFFGVTMLCAISYVTLSTESSPFTNIRRHINPVLAWGWLAASLLANVVWVLPQYALAYGAITNNLFAATFAESKGETSTQVMITLLLMVIVIPVTLSYGGKGKGIKIYEMILKVMVALIVLSFMGVAIALSGSLEWGQIFSGFIPNFSLISEPSAQYRSFLDAIPTEVARVFWETEILTLQRNIMIAAAATAVGINMTFLLPFSLLAKKWNRKFRNLAIFDLATGMVIPFVIATSCIVIAAASQFHGKPFTGLLDTSTGAVVVNAENPKYGAYDSMLSKRNLTQGLESVAVVDSEKQIAAMLIQRGTGDLAGALKSLFKGSDVVSNYVFGFGVLAMAISTISILMLISGFCVCEALGKEHGGLAHRLGTLIPVTGVLWPLLWTNESKAFLAVPTSVFGFVLIPIAYLTFLLMMNSKKVLGDHLPTGGKRLVWNGLMGLAFIIMAPAAAWKAWTTNLTIGEQVIPFGKYALITFIVLVIAGFFFKEKETHAPS